MAGGSVSPAVVGGASASGSTQGPKGDPGTPGSRIILGNGPPPDSLTGNPGDVYVDELTGDLYTLQ